MVIFNADPAKSLRIWTSGTLAEGLGASLSSCVPAALCGVRPTKFSQSGRGRYSLSCSMHSPISSSVQFSCLVMSDSLWPHGLQHTRLPRLLERAWNIYFCGIYWAFIISEILILYNLLIAELISYWLVVFLYILDKKSFVSYMVWIVNISLLWISSSLWL